MSNKKALVAQLLQTKSDLRNRILEMGSTGFTLHKQFVPMDRLTAVLNSMNVVLKGSRVVVEAASLRTVLPEVVVESIYKLMRHSVKLMVKGRELPQLTPEYIEQL